MLKRRHLRAKVLQVLYAFFLSAKDDLASGEKELFLNINKSYDLYLHKLLLLSELGFIAEKFFNDLNTGKQSSKSYNSEKKFLDNQLLVHLRNSKQLNKKCADNKISWSGEIGLLRKIFVQIRKTELYNNYINSELNTFHEDKKFLVRLYRDCICEFEMLHNYFEEKSIYWIDDWDVAVKTTMKTLKSINENDQDFNLMDLYKDGDDKEFVRRLFNETILNKETFDPMISEKTDNWDIDRIAMMDNILMKMALTEVVKFPEIPVKVTLNEYIELSKIYSSNKSKTFINGVLDKLFIDLEKNNKIKKTGKGVIGKT